MVFGIKIIMIVLKKTKRYKNKLPFETRVYNKDGSQRHTKEYNKYRYQKYKKKILKQNKQIRKNRVPDKLRKEVLERDNYECQICGQKSYLGLHHFNNKESDHRIMNLLTLCPACHRLVHNGKF